LHLGGTLIKLLKNSLPVGRQIGVLTGGPDSTGRRAGCSGNLLRRGASAAVWAELVLRSKWGATFGTVQGSLLQMMDFGQSARAISAEALGEVKLPKGRVVGQFEIAASRN